MCDDYEGLVRQGVSIQPGQSYASAVLLATVLGAVQHCVLPCCPSRVIQYTLLPFQTVYH